MIHGLCAVPKEVRLEWLDELFARGTGTECVSPDDLVIRQVLSNLHGVDEFASKRKREAIPKLYPIVRECTLRPSREGSADPVSPPSVA